MFSYEGTDRSRPFLWGHRGAPLLAIENTVASFQKAFAYGLHGVEFDVQFSRDGVPFVFHDENLERLAEIDKRASALVWDDLRTLAIRDPLQPQYGEAHIPKLEEVLEVIAPEGFINLELKHPEPLDDRDVIRMVGLLRDHTMQNRTLISSFRPRHLYQLKELAPDIALAVLWAGEPSMEAIQQSRHRLSRVMHVPLQWVDQFDPALWKGPELSIAVWGLTGRDDVQQCRRAGVDAIFIDSPDWVDSLSSS